MVVDNNWCSRSLRHFGLIALVLNHLHKYFRLWFLFELFVCRLFKKLNGGNILLLDSLVWVAIRLLRFEKKLDEFNRFGW